MTANQENITNYLTKVITTLQTGSAREHAYRPAIHELFEKIKPELNAVNDPARSEHGAPDFIFFKGSVIIGYAETKDIDVNLDKVEKSEQMKRYFGYSNLILTNYLEFRFYKNGEKYGESVSIGELSGGVIVPKYENAVLLEKTIRDFLESKPEQIRGGERLAKIMGGKARRIRENVAQYVSDESEKGQDLKDVYGVMKKLLVHDLDAKQFADMYAQTLVYGLFVARYHDETLETFSRQEARDLVPASNPLLQHFFDHIAGPNFDKRLSYIVDELCEVFACANVRKIMEHYYSRTTLWGETKESPDPVIHFYEDFLKEYDSEQRVKLGAFYTPLPVVKFIVRGVDHLLKKEFGLSQGLADTTKKEFVQQRQGLKGKVLLHQVQILDPATGTGTFLNEVVKHIHQSFEGQQGRWEKYVDDDLLPRLHGFELMMAPYTIAHLKLGMTLRDMGYEKFSKRLGIYLTNSLEEGFKEKENLFTSLGFMKSVAEESKDASIIKNEKPIMVVIGNPPYSGVSSNETDYANSLVNKYKIEPGGKQKLQERKHWLNDDYVKFIALAEDLIEKNGEGIVGFITNHGYLDNPTFRGMRWHLMQTFDLIYALDLHGNSKKKEIAPDGGKDENVFNIQQGVSIILAVKNREKKKKGILAKVYRSDVWGTKAQKFKKLDEISIDNITWKLLDSRMPGLVFAEEGSDELEKEYAKGFSISELFIKSSTGIVTMGDGFIVSDSKEVLENRIQTFLAENVTEDVLKKEYDLGKNYANWIISNKSKIKFSENNIVKMSYRPFDDRFTYFDRNLVWRLREDSMKNLLFSDNVGLIFSRQAIGCENFSHILVSNPIADNRVFFSNKGIPAESPLYIYHEDGSKSVNFKAEILKKITKNLKGEVAPENVLDYIYAVLHCPAYREKFKEFLKIDFPKLPYPKDDETFWQLVEKGKELRSLHLLESPKLQNFITTFPESGSEIVEKVKFENGKVFINEKQYFGNVPEIAWNFFIGGYQPAQKWLKDRKGQTLSNKDLEHWQKIVIALFETDKIMKEIDEINFF